MTTSGKGIFGAIEKSTLIAKTLMGLGLQNNDTLKNAIKDVETAIKIIDDPKKMDEILNDPKRDQSIDRETAKARILDMLVLQHDKSNAVQLAALNAYPDFSEEQKASPKGPGNK